MLLKGILEVQVEQWREKKHTQKKALISEFPCFCLRSRTGLCGAWRLKAYGKRGKNFTHGQKCFLFMKDGLKIQLRITHSTWGCFNWKNYTCHLVAFTNRNANSFPIIFIWLYLVFDDGDERTLRRTSLCLKGERHFAESEVGCFKPYAFKSLFPPPPQPARKWASCLIFAFPPPRHLTSCHWQTRSTLEHQSLGRSPTEEGDHHFLCEHLHPYWPTIILGFCQTERGIMNILGLLKNRPKDRTSVPVKLFSTKQGGYWAALIYWTQCSWLLWGCVLLSVTFWLSQSKLLWF